MSVSEDATNSWQSPVRRYVQWWSDVRTCAVADADWGSISTTSICCRFVGQQWRRVRAGQAELTL